MFLGVYKLVNVNYFRVFNDACIVNVSHLLQISCVKSRISCCFVLLYIYTINLAPLTLLKEIMKYKLSMMFINGRNFYLVSLKFLLKSPFFKFFIKVTPEAQQIWHKEIESFWILVFFFKVYEEKGRNLCTKYNFGKEYNLKWFEVLLFFGGKKKLDLLKNTQSFDYCKWDVILCSQSLKNRISRQSWFLEVVLSSWPSHYSCLILWNTIDSLKVIWFKKRWNQNWAIENGIQFLIVVHVSCNLDVEAKLSCFSVF